MKHFIAANWYRLLVATSLFIFSISFFISTIKNNVAKAGSPTGNLAKEPPANVWIIANDKGIYEITWDRFNKYECTKIFTENGR